jgi:hypothetical protein
MLRCLSLAAVMKDLPHGTQDERAALLEKKAHAANSGCCTVM